jgi:anti-sigma factor RsiW
VTEDHLSCAEIVQLVTDYLEGALDPATASVVTAHLAICPGCVTYVEQIRQTAALLGELPIDTLSGQARAELERAFRGFPRPVG